VGEVAALHPRLSPYGYWTDYALAPRLVVLSGAGLSVESGLSLYRAAEGLWESHNVHQVCHIATWKANADLVHRFYTARRQDVARAQPHAGHRALAALEQEGAVLVTQNIDDLLERAGAQHVLHLHGRAQDIQCTACGAVWAIGMDQPWDPAEDRCPQCSSRRGVKPGVVFFGEQAPLYRALQNLVYGLRPQDVLLTVGTSGEVVNVLDRFGGAEGEKWLANREPQPSLPTAAFARTWYAPITESIEAIVAAWRAHEAQWAASRRP
jgi:NAD-dependent deacetylase